MDNIQSIELDMETPLWILSAGICFSHLMILITSTHIVTAKCKMLNKITGTKDVFRL